MPRFSLLVMLLWLPSVHAEEDVDYVKQIKPLLKERCYSCHGSLKQKAGLRLDTVRLMKDGGDNGPALVAGAPLQSPIIQRVVAFGKDRMPPLEEGEAFTPAQVDLLRRWIAQGAKGPATEKAEEDPRKHWAFRRPVRPELPDVQNSEWSQHPIDRFLASAHEKRQLTPAPVVEKSLLLRRVYLDLIGLPPTPAELQVFLSDASPDAFAKVVDALLARPQYGERWARHWMDVWRYADWHGRREVPDVWNSAPQIWRWRDWIVKSLNRDLGYDAMMKAMIAADEIHPGDDETAVATGYLVRNWYALNPNQWMRDNVEHVGKAFLGLTFNCAHCHDHKYDPITQEDYFRLRAFFEPIGLRQDRVRGEADPGPFQKYELAVLRKIVKPGRVAVYDEKPQAETFMYHGGDERSRMKDKAPVQAGVPTFLAREKLEWSPIELPVEATYPGLQDWAQKDETAHRQQAVDAAKSALAKAKSADARGLEAALAEIHVDVAEARLASFQTRLRAERVKYQQDPGDWAALAKLASQAQRHEGAVLAREKWLKAEMLATIAQGKLLVVSTDKEKESAEKALKNLQHAALAAKKSFDASRTAFSLEDTKYLPLSPQYSATSTGRRKALGEWLGSRDNPLTARVAVNHIWLRHFDRPLVETVFDFGRNGKAPTHPELLDWLAVEFIESGWSMKHLHRLIVTSRAYRMQAAGMSASAPDNRLLWRFPAKRMEAEVVRDTLLYLTGDLDLRLGGEPLDNKDEATSKRRSLYFSVYPEAGGHAKFLEIFDAPSPADCYQRQTSIVPQQALALTNNQLAINQSRLLARKWTALEDDAFIAAGFSAVLCREPTEAERNACVTFLGEQTKLLRASKEKTSAAPGVTAPAADPGQRARESLIRVLFNHHDFVTIR